MDGSTVYTYTHVVILTFQEPVPPFHVLRITQGHSRKGLIGRPLPFTKGIKLLTFEARNPELASYTWLKQTHRHRVSQPSKLPTMAADRAGPCRPRGPVPLGPNAPKFEQSDALLDKETNKVYITDTWIQVKSSTTSLSVPGHVPS